MKAVHPMKSLIAPLVCALLLGCAAPPKQTAPSRSAGPATPAKTSTASSAKDTQQETVVCSDESATGSNIRRRRCERITEELRRERQAQVDALQQRGSANAGAPSGVR